VLEMREILVMRRVSGRWLQNAGVSREMRETWQVWGCNSHASLAGLVLCFIACFILLVIAPLLDANNAELLRNAVRGPRRLVHCR